MKTLHHLTCVILEKAKMFLSEVHFFLFLGGAVVLPTFLGKSKSSQKENRHVAIQNRQRQVKLKGIRLTCVAQNCLCVFSLISFFCYRRDILSDFEHFGSPFTVGCFEEELFFRGVLLIMAYMMGTFFRLQAYGRIGLLPNEVYGRVGFLLFW